MSGTLRTRKRRALSPRNDGRRIQLLPPTHALFLKHTPDHPQLTVEGSHGLLMVISGDVYPSPMTWSRWSRCSTKCSLNPDFCSSHAGSDADADLDVDPSALRVNTRMRYKALSDSMVLKLGKSSVPITFLLASKGATVASPSADHLITYLPRCENLPPTWCSSSKTLSRAGEDAAAAAEDEDEEEEAAAADAATSSPPCAHDAHSSSTITTIRTSRTAVRHAAPFAHRISSKRMGREPQRGRGKRKREAVASPSLCSLSRQKNYL